MLNSILSHSILPKNSNIIFTQADERNIMIVMDKDFYINKIEELLKDKNIYYIIKNILPYILKKTKTIFLKSDYEKK